MGNVFSGGQLPANGTGADGAVLALFPGDQPKFDASAGQSGLQSPVIQIRHGGEGLRTHIAAGDAEPGGVVAGENFNVQTAPNRIGTVPILQKIGGKGGGGDQIGGSLSKFASFGGSYRLGILSNISVHFICRLMIYKPRTCRLLESKNLPFARKKE